MMAARFWAEQAQRIATMTPSVPSEAGYGQYSPRRVGEVSRSKNTRAYYNDNTGLRFL
jgi:FKBP-type peptidyl-prolyl cis-trans isomerase 2